MRRCPQSAPLSTWARAPFLELLVTNCVTLAEDCTRPRTKRILRLLAADLALEAEKYRATTSRHEATCVAPVHRESSATEVEPMPAEHAAV